MHWQSSAPLYPQAFFLGLFSSLPLLLVLLLACAAGSGVAWFLRRGARDYRRGCSLWELGLAQKAQPYFLAAARMSFGRHRAAALAWVGLCLLHRGEYVRAVATLEPLMGRALPRSMRPLWAALPGHLSLCLALLGDVVQAHRWLEEAHRRCEGTDASVIVPEAALLCREGYFGAALQRLEDGWPLLEWERCLYDRARLLREFARWRLWPNSYERECFVDWMLLAPFREEELDFFDEHWLDLAFFMSGAQSLYRRYTGEGRSGAATRTTPV
jgi:tetratricopeptide (TPR) repeat protein